MTPGIRIFRTLGSMTVKGGLTWTNVQLRESPKPTVERRRGTADEERTVGQKAGHRRPDRHRYIGAHGGEGTSELTSIYD